MAERFASVSEDELRDKMYNKTIIEIGFRMILTIRLRARVVYEQKVNSAAPSSLTIAGRKRGRVV